ncbi:hypothetical protein PAL_GLEAN10021755 [Pteropus alecto]|uniref:Uncharacterized protein n=1 Tax=Pteropus alecto TaxID=9402 RepID=L5KPF8_PTEAL|nr:hypothetical protein PAL_GLEAN10021755 [Pteropus alecto]
MANSSIGPQHTAKCAQSSAMGNKLERGSCRRGPPLGGSDRLRAQQSTQEPGAGAESRVQLRPQGPHYCPAPSSEDTEAGKVKEGRREGGGRARLPSSVYLDALGSGGSGSPSAAAAPGSGGGARAAPGGCGRGARRMCCLTLRGPRGSRSSGSQHFLSLPEPDTDGSRSTQSAGLAPPPAHALHAPRPSRGGVLRFPSRSPGLSGRWWRRPEAGSEQGTCGGQSVHPFPFGWTHT